MSSGRSVLKFDEESGTKKIIAQLLQEACFRVFRFSDFADPHRGGGGPSLGGSPSGGVDMGCSQGGNFGVVEMRAGEVRLGS